MASPAFCRRRLWRRLPLSRRTIITNLLFRKVSAQRKDEVEPHIKRGHYTRLSKMEEEAEAFHGHLSEAGARPL